MEELERLANNQKAVSKYWLKRQCARLELEYRYAREYLSDLGHIMT